nr:LON peptidase substrate-binding domain-containing protein [Clostridia bacterium]
MSRFIEKAETYSLDVIPLRGAVIFPGIQTGFELGESKLLDICEKANKSDDELFFVCQKDPTVTEPDADGLYRVGTVAKVKQFLRMPDGSARIIADGITRATVISYMTRHSDGVLRADVLGKSVYAEEDGGVRAEAMVREAQDLLEEFAKYMPKLSGELIASAKTINTPGLLADYITCHVLVNFADKQEILEIFDPVKRIDTLLVMMERELEILDTELDIHKRVHSKIEQNQREYYLREQMKIIRDELDMAGDPDSEIEEYYDKIDALKLAPEIEEKLYKEIKKLTKLPFGSAEGSVIKSYLDVCLEFPWKKITKDRVDIEAASKILERDHDGLEKVKQRILEFLAVKQLNPDVKNQILCLVGPPGTGKT